MCPMVPDRPAVPEKRVLLLRPRVQAILFELVEEEQRRQADQGP